VAESLVHESVAGHAGLVLSGGGARGAYQVGVISALAERRAGSCPFPVITGVSVGAINAIVLAEGADDFPAAAAKLERLWRGLHSHDIFATDAKAMASQLGGWLAAILFGRFGAEPPTSFLDNRPLGKLLARSVDFSRIQTMIDEGPLQALAVTASSYGTGKSVTFFQGKEPDRAWARARRFGQVEPLGVAHVLASAALPGVFPAQRLGQTWFGDGALRQNMPLSSAIHLGCDRLLTIAARDGTPDTEDKLFQGAEHPSLGIIGGQLLDIIFNDYLDADIERLQRINETLEAMLPERRAQTALKPIHHHLVRPSQDIRELAGRHAHEAPGSVRTLLNILGAMRPPWVLPSYLTFEPGYIGSLIDLGRADAEAQMPELLQLIGNEPPQTT